MIKLEKQVTIIIDGDDVQTLRSVCNACQCYMVDNSPLGYNWHRGEATSVAQFAAEEVLAMARFVEEIREA